MRGGKAKEPSVRALDSFNKLLTKSQQLNGKRKYSSFFDDKRKIFAYFCTFCKNELDDGAVVFKGVASCDRCLQTWAEFHINLFDEDRRKRTPKVIKTHRCFECDGYFVSGRMSSILGICKKCAGLIRGLSGKERARRIERSIRRISRFMRRQSI